MTNGDAVSGIIGPMKSPIPGLAARFLMFPLVFTAFLRAEEPDLRGLLREGLVAEEVDRDPAKAAAQYEEIVRHHDADRRFAASAMFRLAEVRRKQERPEDAARLYQRLVREFPEAAEEGKQARAHLLAMGKDVPADTGAPSEEEAELRRLAELAASAPDILHDPHTMENAIKKGWSRVVGMLLERGVEPSPHALPQAAAAGYLDVVRTLLEAGAPSPEVGATALCQAIRFKRHGVLEFLLEREVNPNSLETRRNQNSPALSPLHVAIEEVNFEATKLLLAKGADPNVMASPPPKALANPNSNWPLAGTPLLLAIGRDAKLLDLLLESGARPLPDALTQVTPLHMALEMSGQDCLDAVRKLLAAGADPNASTRNGVTPLEKTHGNLEKIELLITHGADIKRTRESGAILLRSAAQNLDISVVKRLIELGALPDEEFIASGFAEAGQEAQAFLLRRFMIPRLLESSAITVIAHDLTGTRQFELASRRTSEAPPQLEWLFLENMGDRWPKWHQDGRHIFADIIRIWSKNDNGSLSSSDYQLTDNSPFPRLAWGNVVELLNEKNVSQNTTSGDRRQPRQRIEPAPQPHSPRSLPTEIAWHIRKRIRFAVTVELPGREEREITLRGDRLVFDPTKDEVPLVGAGQLVELLWQPLNPLPPGNLEVVIQRKDWQDIRLGSGQRGARGFSLHEGDRIRLENHEDGAAEAADTRKQHVALVVPGFPFVRRFGDGPDGLSPLVTPTLFQALADAINPFWSPFKTPEDPSSLPAALLGHLPVVLPHPDFSRIKLRRLKEDGGEETMDVDLTSAISAWIDGGRLPEDIDLRAGDVVELPLQPDLKEPWKGMSDAESRFFSSVLRARMQVTRDDGSVILQEVEFEPVRFVETEAGWLPLGDFRGGGAPTMRGAFHFEWSYGKIQRGSPSTEEVDLSAYFIRNGDQIRPSGPLRRSPPPIPPNLIPPPSFSSEPPQVTQPPQRVVPPPVPVPTD